jgi:hypothetical protein
MAFPNTIISQAFQPQLVNLQVQLDGALSAYAGSQNQTSLIAALKIQAQITDLLLSANNLQTARSIFLSRRIQVL